MIKSKLLLLLMFVCAFGQLDAQEEKGELIQFSGVAVSNDSLNPVPFVTILVKHTARGTTSDYYGYFSFVAKKGDTLIFTSIGYKESKFIVPDSLIGNRYSLIHAMYRDTVNIETVNVYPWPTPEQFKEAFLALDVPDDDLEVARKNLSPELLASKAEAMPMGGSLNFKWQNQQRVNQLYFIGQYRPIPIFDPIAWSKFIQAWKNGDFKRKDKK
ncbi:MAG: hypothetical protein CMO34_02300 [Verrucomicrobia bacterium]|nr:hypothetical protein [Verrucomicrobiota bacterium]